MKTMTVPSLKQIRWLIRRDLDEVLQIDRASFRDFWTEEDWLRALRQRNCIGTVAEANDGSIVGFMCHELHKDSLGLVRLAVAPEWRRNGIGAAMLGRLIGKLRLQQRKSIECRVDEYDLAAQLWLSACGFIGLPAGDEITFSFYSHWDE